MYDFWNLIYASLSLFLSSFIYLHLPSTSLIPCIFRPLSFSLSLFLVSFLVYFLVASNPCFCLASFPSPLKLRAFCPEPFEESECWCLKSRGTNMGGSGNFNCVTKSTTNRARIQNLSILRTVLMGSLPPASLLVLCGRELN